MSDYLTKPVYLITNIEDLQRRRDHDVATLAAESGKWFASKTKAELQIAELQAENARLKRSFAELVKINGDKHKLLDSELEACRGDLARHLREKL